MSDCEEKYREYVNITLEHQELLLSYIRNHHRWDPKRTIVWLQMMGLMETWDVTKPDE